MADVFISYSKQDPEPTERLAAELERQGYSVWWDTSLLTGANFREVILRELAAAKAVIVIWTPNSVKSDWVTSEADRARAARKLVPLRLPEVDIHDIPPPFDRLQTDFVAEVDKILRTLATLCGTPSIQAAQYVNRGNLHFKNGDLDQAITHYTKAIALNPNYWIAYHNRGVVYQSDFQGHQALGLAEYTKAIELNGNSAPSYCNRGLAYETLRNRNRAMADYEKAIKLDPRYALTYKLRGHVYYKMKDYSRAIDDFGKALMHDTNDAETYYTRGKAHAWKGEYALAIPDYTEAIKRRPKDADFYDARATAYEDSGDNTRASADWRYARSIDPNPLGLRRGLVILYIRPLKGSA